MKERTYFVSSRWRNRDTVLELVDRLRSKGMKVLSFFENTANIDDVNEDPEEMMKKWEAMPNWQQEEVVKKIFGGDTSCIKESETVILLLPAGISAHVEIGYAYGLGKKCILIGKPEKTESAYMLFDESYESIDDFIDSLGS